MGKTFPMSDRGIGQPLLLRGNQFENAHEFLRIHAIEALNSLEEVVLPDEVNN